MYSDHWMPVFNLLRVVLVASSGKKKDGTSATTTAAAAIATGTSDALSLSIATKETRFLQLHQILLGIIHHHRHHHHTAHCHMEYMCICTCVM
jgi:hypothetical protein